MTVPTPTPDDERQLLARLSSGDEDEANRAIGEIVVRYQGVVEKTAWPIVRDRDALEDVKQNVWVACWRHCQMLAERGQLREYLVTVARTRALNWRRDERHKADYARTTAALHLANDLHTVENDAVLQLTVDDRERTLSAVLAAMPSRRREIFTLVTQDGHTHEQVAKLLNISPRTVSNQMWQANESMRHAFTKEANHA